MNTKRNYIIGIILLLVASSIIFTKTQSKEVNNKWYIYFAPTSTEVAYGNKDATLVEVNSDGNLKYYHTDAYPCSGLINYEKDIIFQNPKGLSSLKSNSLNQDITKDINTIGYNMADTIKNCEIFYFLSNECFKKDFYSSKLIIGDSGKQSLHQIEGFVNAYGNDNDNIYLVTSNMKNRYLKQIQKISINSQDDISIEKNDITFDTIIGSDNKMIINDDNIYCFTIKERFSVSLLKISTKTLKVENVFDLIKFNDKEDNDKYYPISTNSIFYFDDKIYYPTKEGKVYSFNIKNNEFVKEFSIKNYSLNPQSNLISYYSKLNNEIYFLYLDNVKNKYCICTYDLNGNLKNSLYLYNLNINNKLYAHSFIKED
ncbi:hypothetical protein [Clostridium sp. HBUAS56017]|uniref:hypothetical protein n=1 Tax=Clostridium sp. HBUAS56017 TaxID=2571128 RepID=UPI0011786557|nr:hypothetical protein [Clostridium sp. HBUAS56017]